MRQILQKLTCLAVLWAGVATYAGEPAPDRVHELAHGVLMELGSDPAIVTAVKVQNALSMEMKAIRDQDTVWKNTVGISPIMARLMESECSKRLLEITADAPYLAEIFVMDHLGANVAMTDKTSDYWQGDESKFLACFPTGAVFVDEVEFDESTMAFLSQVSIPVRDGGQVIGVVTFGINVEVIEGRGI